MSAPREVVVAPSARVVGREVARILDAGGQAAGFVGDIEVDIAAIDEFRNDVMREAG